MPKYKVGDVVRVKDFEDIVAESGGCVDSDGDVRTNDAGLYFLKSMRECCGNQYIVREAFSSGGDSHVWDRYCLEGVGYVFSNSTLCDASYTQNIEISHSFDELFFASQ